VEKAAAFIEKEGEKGFSEFEKKGGEWFQGESYIFGMDLSGYRVFYPPDPSTDGQYILDLKDVNGKPIMRQMLDRVSGWTHYQWPKPGETDPHWKSTYTQKVLSPSGKEYLIGNGRYDMKIDKVFFVDVVNQATDLVKKMGRKAFPIFHDQTGPYLFQDAYIFIYTNQGINQVLPYDPSKEGTSLFDYRDENGKLVIQEFINTAQSNPEGGWVEYQWPKPGETKQLFKISFVKAVTVEGETFIVGCGFYPDNS